MRNQVKERTKEEASFLKKRSKKLLFTLECADRGRRAPIDKVFLLLFVHKKKTSSFALVY